MGQRLNIELYKNDELQLYANCYYHWSAYTLSSLYTLKRIIENYRNIKDKYSDPVLLATKCFEIPDESIRRDENGNITRVECYAGLCDKSKKLMTFLYPNESFYDAIDRNVGLISIHPGDVDNTRTWEEGRMTVNLDKEWFSFDVFCCIYPDELKEWYPSLRRDEISKILDISDLNIDIMEYIKFDDIDKVMEIFDKYDLIKTVDFNGDDVYIQQFS